MIAVQNLFVFIHMPKTGGSFVREALRRIHFPNREYDDASEIARKIALINTSTLTNSNYYTEFDKHGTSEEIPDDFHHLPIISCFRNPFEWYISNYKYEWWKTHPESYPGLSEDPNWPNINFDYFMELSNHKWTNLRNPSIRVNPSLGRLTTLFINYYCREPDVILREGNSDEEVMSLIKANQFPVHFLETDNLNNHLYETMIKYGYERECLEFILTKKKVSPRNNRSAEDVIAKYYDGNIQSDVIYRDRFIFSQFQKYL